MAVFIENLVARNFTLFLTPYVLSIIQVTASSWLNDLRDQIQQTRFLNVVYRSATALGTRLQSFSGARERVAGAGAFLRPVSNKTQVHM